MGVLQQCRLLLNKNVLFRKRHPGILVLEVIWPVLIIVIVALIRVAVPPTESPTCHYQDRAMPSAGLVPFLQTFVCNLDNKCHSEDSRQNAQQSAASFSSLVQQITPFLGDEGTLQLLDNVDVGVVLLDSFNNLATDETLMSEFDNATILAHYFRDPDKLKRELVTTYNFTQEAVDALVESQANISAILQLAGYPDLKGVTCDPEQLSQFLVFPPGTNTTEVSRTLCDISDSKIPGITNVLLNQLDVPEVIRLLGLFETLKERLNIPYSIADGLKDVADMLDLLLSSDSLVSSWKELASIKTLPDIIRNLPRWIDQISQSGSVVQPFQELFMEMDPLISKFFPNDTMWASLKEGITLGSGLVDLLNGKGNTSVDFMEHASSFLQDIEGGINELPHEIKQTLDALSTVNWNRLWELLTYSGENNETALMLAMDELQKMMQDTPLWEDISRYTPLVTDLIHTVNVILHELIEAHEGILQLQAGQGGLKQVVDSVLQRGPNVTLAILKAFTDPDTLASLLADGMHFSAVCMDIMEAISKDTGSAVAQELNATLCHSDVSQTINSLIADLGVNNISMAMDKTIARLMAVFSGNMTQGPVSFKVLWQEIQMMTHNLVMIGNVTSSWADLFSITDPFTDLMSDHLRDWEPVLDMLDENYIGASVLSLIGAAGKLMNDSSSAQWMQTNLGPYVHMAAVMVKTFYNEMKAVQDTYSRDSPLGQLVYYGTSYAPQILSSVMDMRKNGNTDMIYKLASSNDSMSTFCGEHMMHQMGVPYDVAVSMENAICLSNWTEVGEQIMSTSTPVSVAIEKMVVTMYEMERGLVNYSLENDWRDLSYYTSRTMDMMMSSVQIPTEPENDPLQVLMLVSGGMNEGPWTLAMYANYSQVNVAMEMMMNKMQTMTDEDLNIFINIVGIMMANMERLQADTITMNDLKLPQSQWRLIKHIVRIVDDVNIITMEGIKQDMMMSLQTFMDSYPDELKEMVNLAANAYLEFIDALRTIILKPDQLIHKMISQGLQAPNCDNITITEMLMMAPNSSFGQLERTVCMANWTDIALKMASLSQAQPVTAAVDDLNVMISDLAKLEIDPVVNWTQTLYNSVDTVKTFLNMLQTLEQTPTFDLLPFNMTAISAKWAQFYKDIAQLENIDFASLSAALQELQQLQMDSMMQQIPDNTDLLRILNANTFLSQHLLNFINIQLSYFNSMSEVNLLDMLGSDELRKVAEVLRYSPEINEIGVNTLIRMILDPTTVAVMDPSILCTNMTLFRQVVAVNDSVIDTSLLQNTVCSLEVNTTALLKELRQNWDGFSELMDSFQLLFVENSTLSGDITTVMASQNKLNELLTSVLQHPPTVTLFNSSQWMNAALYEAPWNRLGEELQKMYEKYQDPNALMNNLQMAMTSYLSTVTDNPDMQIPLLYMDAFLDQFLVSMSAASSIPQSFVGYPNLERLYSLLEQFPELMEMLIYTAMRHPEQLNNWGGAMVSWETFCHTDPTTLMTAPPAGGLDVREVFGRLCSINITQLSVEYNTFQGMDRLNRLFAGENVTDTVNVTALAEKMNMVLGQFSANSTMLTMYDGMRFLNATVWGAVLERLDQNFNQTLTETMTVEGFLHMLTQTSTLFPEFGGLQGTIEQGLAMMDIVLDQMLSSLQGGSLQEMVSQYPTVKRAVILLDSLPEIYETLAYTGLYTPQKLMEHFQEMMSFETFCSTDIDLILTAPPQSDYNLTAWQQMMCSINVTEMLEELAEFQGSTAIANIFAPNATLSVNLTSISEKLERLGTEGALLLTGSSMPLDINMFFNITAWGTVMQRLQTWMQDASQLWSSASFYKNLVSASVLSSFQAAIPEVNTALHYTSAILDVVEQQLKSSTTPLSRVFTEYPNLNTMVSLLGDMPDIFEIFAYTTLQHQEQLALWTPAMASWDTFCSFDANALLTAPPASRVTVSSVLQRLCSINVTELMIELNQYQGMERLQTVLLGYTTEKVNSTAVAEQLSGIIDNLQTLYTTPMEATLDLRVFNMTVWEQVFERLGNGLNGTQQNLMSPGMLMDFFNKLFGNIPGMNDTDGTLDKMWAMTDIILGQMLRSLEGGNLEEMFKEYPTVQSAFGLLNSLPEIYETVMYTALYAPDKVVARMDAFNSLVTFCTTDMSTIFTVPPATDFNLAVWQMKFCTLNLTLLMTELAEYQGTQDVENIFAANSTVKVNLTSVILKMESVLSKFSQMGNARDLWMNPGDRFLNTTLWEHAISNLEKWTSDPNALFWMNTEKVMQLYEQMMAGQDMELIQPLYSVMYLIAEKMVLYENKTSFTLEELFMGAPEMQKLMELLQQPGVIEVLMQSLNSEKFKPVFGASMTDAFAMLCAPSANLDQYLTVPDGVSIDLSTLKTHLCGIDLMRLPQEFMDFIGVDRFMDAVNGSLYIDFTTLNKEYGRLSALITRWVQMPPTFTLPSAWQNESFWLNMLEVYSRSRQTPDAILQEFENLIDSLGPLVNDDSMKQIALVAETMMRLLNENLLALQNQNLTLENHVQRLPILHDVLSALGIEGDILDAMLKAPVRSDLMVVEALLTSGTAAQESVCNITRLQEMLQLPASFNTTALYQAVCLNNATEAVNNILRNLKLQDLLNNLESPSSVANWTKIFRQSKELQQIMQDLIAHPPTFNATSFIARLETNFNTSNFLQTTTMLKYYYQLFGMIDAFPELKPLEGILKSTSVVVEFLNDMVNRLVMDGTTLDLASLFSSSPSFVRLINAALHAKPDPVTALSFIQLNPSKATELMTLDVDNLQPIFCSSSEFQEYFIVPAKANITKILDVLCSMNFTLFVEELDKNFMVDALTKKFAMSMNESEPFNIQKYTESYMNLIERITTLAGANNVTFNGSVIHDALDINTTQLLEALQSINIRLQEEYPSLMASSLNSALAGFANMSEGRDVIYALKVVELYFQSFYKELEDISSGPISLAAIVNNTEVGNIIIPFLQNPYSLEDLLNLELLPRKLSSLLMRDNIMDALCGPELFTAFAAPGNQSAVLQQLQTSVCETNTTVMMWQAIMGQSRGYQLYQQMQILYREVTAGRTSINVTAIDSNIRHLVTMVMQIVGEYQYGIRSTEDMLDWRAFQNIFNRFSASIGGRLMNISEQWSMAMAGALLSSFPDDVMSSTARTINTINIFMNIINNRLDDMIKNGISLASLLNHSSSLVRLMEAYLDVTQLSPQAWMDNQFNISRMIEVSFNETILNHLCTTQTLAVYLADTHSVTTVTSSMQTVMCSIITELPETFKEFVDYEAVQQQIEAIWNMSEPVEPQYQQYVDNIARFNTLITELATKSPSVDPQLSSTFDFTGMLQAMENIATRPEMIFRLLKAFGIVLEGPLKTNDLENTFYGLDAYVAQPLLALVEQMDQAGISLAAVQRDPSKLLESLPVLLNFNLHFDVITSTYIQPTINKFWNNEDFRNRHLCNGSLPRDIFTSVGLHPSVMSTLCTVPTTEWVQTLKSLNTTEAQILTWVRKMEVEYFEVPLCNSIVDLATGASGYVCDPYHANIFDNKGMYWMRLMSTLESVATHLVPDNSQVTATNVGQSLGRMVDILKNAFLNTTLRSAMNYLEAVDRMGGNSEDWLVFKQVMKFLESAGSLLNSGLQRGTGSTGTVHLQNMLPDPQKLADLLHNILGPVSASEILAASVNPELFYQLAYPDKLKGVACDPSQFSNMFNFPVGTNITAIQTALCDALTTQTTSLQELVDLFQAGDMLVQLDRLINGNFSSVASEMGLWQALYKTVSEMLSHFEQLQSGNFNTTVTMSWLDPVLQQLMSLGQSSATDLEDLCQSYIGILGGSSIYQMYQGEMVFISKIINLASKVAPFITGMDDLVCTMIKDDGLDFRATVDYLRQHGLEELLQAVSDLVQNGTHGQLPCSQLVKTSTQLPALITNMTETPIDIDQLAQCMQRGSPLFADVLQGFTQLYSVIADLSDLLQADDIRVLLQNSGQMGKTLDFILGIILNEKSAVLQFTDLLTNSTDVQSYLTGVAKLAPQAVNSLLASTINLNASTFLSKSVEEIAVILCQPARLRDVVTLPDVSPLNISEVSKLLCTATVNFTAAVLKDAGQSMDIIGQLTAVLSPDPTGLFVKNLTNNLVDLFTQLQSISTLVDLMDNVFDTKFLMENADSIDAILAGGGTIQKIVDSLSSLVGTLKYVVPSEDHDIITEIQTFIKGLVGLDLIQSRLLGAISVADLQKDASSVLQYLINDLDFSPHAASAIMSSTYSIRVFLNASGILLSEEPCSIRLKQFILLNTTQELDEEITSKFCDLNSTEVAEFMEIMVPELDVGSLLQQYITYSGKGFLDSINMTQSEVKTVFQSLSDGSQTLGQAAQIMTDDNATMAPLLYSIGENPEGEFDAMTSMQSAMCGDQGTVNDQFNLNDKVQGAQSAQDIAEEAQMNGEFCKKLYRNVKNSRMGSVIWSFVKPIMSGKILYTPDTLLTRQIITNANWVFDTLSEVKRVSKLWSEKAPNLLSLMDSASELSAIEGTLNNGFIQGMIRTTLGVDTADLTKELESLKSSNMNDSDVRLLQKVAELVYNYSNCLELDRFEPVASEAELESRAFELYKTNNFFGGIVFLDMESSTGNRRKRQTSGSSTLPPHIKYKIRVEMDNVPTTNRLKDRLWIPYAKDDFANDLRYMRGFIQLQDMMENAIVQLQTSSNYTATGVAMQQMPFPCHTEDDYIHYLGSYLLPILMTFAWLAAIGIATHNLVYDRQNGQEESLRIMGMVSGLNILAWVLVTFVIMAVVTAIITTIFKFSGVFQYSNWFLLFLFFLDFCFSTIMMCYFISSFFSRVTLAILSVLIIYFISYLPYVVLVSAEVQMTFWQKSLASLSSTTAFSFGAIFITRFEEETIGLQWDKMNDKIGDSVDFAWLCYMMLIDSGIYLVLGWYIRNVKPGKYGVKQPWYFPVLPSYWCSCLSSSIKTLPPPGHSNMQGMYEPAPEHLDVGISVRGLRKRYKGKAEVVHGLDVDIFHDQITTLLGHNGAAKTTTLNMLVGVLDPTGGTVLVEGKKTLHRTGLIGICPQHNTLFEYMTVLQHMEFYSGVKGHMSSSERRSDICKLLHDVDLWHTKDVPAMNLSGGMQRRLCVALAFVGGSKTIVLDEPTSGVDPHARKYIWNLILKNRPGRTILMSTHHLDEADMLSDRILIMHSGRLLSVGSPAFLKDQLSGGYRLTLNTNPTLDVQNEMLAVPASSGDSTEQMSSQHAKIMTFIRSGIPSAKFVESVGSDLTVSLPHQGDNSAVLSQFFHQLDAQTSGLGVLSYGISNVTLEEVFLKLTSEADSQASQDSHDHNAASSTDSESVSTDSDNTMLRSSGNRPTRTATGISLKMQQLGALLMKRVHHCRRNWRMIISTLILPLIAFLCAMGFSTIRPTTDDMQNLIMTPALYSRDVPDSYAFFKKTQSGEAAQRFVDTLMAGSPGIGTTCMEGFNPGKGFKCVAPGRMEESPQMEQVCQCDDYSYHCEDGTQREGVMQMMTRPDIVLQDLGLKDINNYLVDSYVNYIDRRFGGWSLEPPVVSGNTSTPMVKVWFNNKAYHAIPSFFNALSNNLLRSTINPADAPRYGITLYNHPLMFNEDQLSNESIEATATDVGIAMVILLALSFIPSAFMVYLVNEKVSLEKHLQSISGVGTVLYWTASFLWDMIVYSCALAIMVAVVAIFQSEGFYDRENLAAFALLVFLYGLAVIPAMYCTLRFFKTGSSAYLTLFCTNMIIGLLTTIVIFVLSLLHSNEDIKTATRVLKYIFLVFPQFSLGMGLVDLVSNQVQYKLLKRFGEDTYVSPFDREMLGWNYVALGAETVIFMLLTFIIHSQKKRALGMSSSMHYNASKEDEDVYNEQEMVRSGGNGNALAVKDLCKVYMRGSKRFCAVNHLSFGVNKGECFGLLGVNGAGKTTTFKMLTGATTPSEGDAIIQQKRLSALRAHLGDEIGYCPQEDALDIYLSGRETLRFHGKLRGFESEMLDAVVSEQLKELHLEHLADKAVSTYSGGNKRKLALAIAMLGDPPLLLLDEPTTGMDAGTRRLAWKCILKATQRGQSVLLTSHSMDECDALCSRLAIMVNGQLKCIGSPQHLKNKFGEGYTVLLHLQGLSSSRYSVAESFMAQFPGSVIKDQHHSVVEIGIPQGVGSVANIFAAVQNAQAHHHILYYSVSQTTLDTVFVNFAREQTDDNDHDSDTESSRGSSSGDSGTIPESSIHKSITGGPLGYTNPEYSIDPMDSFGASEPLPAYKGGALAYNNKAYDSESFITKL